jgi:hypothetical protein
MSRIRICLAIVTAMTIGLSTECFGLDWEFQTVDTVGNAGSGCSLALDSNDSPHISYIHDGISRSLRYAVLNGGSWSFETIDGSPSVYSAMERSLALDHNDVPMVAYAHRSGQAKWLSYASRNAGGWQSQVVDDSFYNWPRDCTLLVDPAGQVHLSYFSSYSYEVRYATLSQGAWNKERISFRPLYSSSQGIQIMAADMILDETGTPFIAAVNPPQLDMLGARLTPNGWTVENLHGAGDSSWDLELLYDSSDTTHILYGYGFQHSWQDGNGWLREGSIDTDADCYYEADMDSKGNTHVAYIDRYTDQLKYAMFDGTDWTMETISEAPGLLGADIDLHVDSLDRIHIAYYDKTQQDLIYGIGVPEPTSLVIVLFGGMLLSRRRK